MLWFWLACSMSLPAPAAVLRVPGDYSTIQAAIEATRTGDTVVVSPGTYNESISFRRRAITLTSANPNDPATVSNTIIRSIAKRSAVTFAAGEKSNSVITGFTITGGYGSSRTVNGVTNFYGGGIYCLRSSPTIVGNIITGNAGPTEAALPGYGGGIGCIESEAIITRNLIMGNRSLGGGGIMLSLSRARIANNIIVSNSAIYGGGIAMEQGGRVANNTLVGNEAQVAGQIYAMSDLASPCVINGNIIADAREGGGVVLEPQDQLTEITFNDVWNNAGGNFPTAVDRIGVDGNISQSPRFVAATPATYRLEDGSPCINAGDPGVEPTLDETDFYGGPRVYARRVDIGATEYSDNYRPLANAGPDRVVAATYLPFSITLDGSGSTDPNNGSLTYRWEQLSGPNSDLSDPTASQPTFNLPTLGTYVFALVVRNGGFSSLSDSVRIIAKNEAPTASAGSDQAITDVSSNAIVTLDGSRSLDPENTPLRYHWQQLGGWKVSLSDSNAAQPTLLHPWPGIYQFSLVVDDGMQPSLPDLVTIGIGPNSAPVADAGQPRYVAGGSVTLDATRSYDPDGYGTLTYQWRQVSGPTATLAGASTAAPLCSGFVARTTNQVCVFELIVSDGYLVSQPSLTKVTVVPNFGTSTLRLVNPPFDSTKPTILAFGGGDCVTGSGMNFGGVWEERANWLTVSSYDFPYHRYGDMLITYLSSVAPDYRQAIQTMGHSTGNMPAMEAAWQINATYRDPRYLVNRVALLDPVCSSLASLVAKFNTNRIAGEQAWVDNYVSYDPNFPAAAILPGALNVVCRPQQNHSYPPIRYRSSSLDYEANGLTPFAYLSVIGAGKNYQLNPAAQKYYLAIGSDEMVTFFNETQFPGKLLAPVQLTGPADGAILAPPSDTPLGCEPVDNAARYQLLIGSDPSRVMDFEVISETPTPPSRRPSTLPQSVTWWTVKAIDSFGSSIYADPRRIRLPENRPPIAHPGPSQAVFAGPNGLAQVTLDGNQSTDPDGDPLTFTWVWMQNDRAAFSNGVRVTLELPLGSHLAQLMVNDGRTNSAIAEVSITVQPNPAPSLRIQRSGDRVILLWDDPTFSLESAPVAWSPFTKVVGATSGYTVPASRSQQYYRLTN